MTREESVMEKTLEIPEFLTEKGAEKGRKVANAVLGTLGFLMVFGLGVATTKASKRK